MLTRMSDQSGNAKAVRREGLEVIVLLLSPIIPHITDAIWRAIGKETAQIDAAWPRADAEALIEDECQLVVQVNGKKRAQIVTLPDAPEELIQAAALNNENVQRHISGKEVKKVIVVPQRLVNIVVG